MDISAFLFLFVNEDLVEKWPALILGFIIIEMQKLLMKNLKVRILVWILGLLWHTFEYASNKNLIKASHKSSLLNYVVLFQYYR